jgi:hypothetical protein
VKITVRVVVDTGDATEPTDIEVLALDREDLAPDTACDEDAYRILNTPGQRPRALMIRLVECWEEPGEGSGQTCHYPVRRRWHLPSSGAVLSHRIGHRSSQISSRDSGSCSDPRHRPSQTALSSHRAAATAQREGLAPPSAPSASRRTATSRRNPKKFRSRRLTRAVGVGGTTHCARVGAGEAS